MYTLTGIMDRIIDIILETIDAKTTRLIIRIVCGIFLLIIFIWLVVFIYHHVSSQKELRRWVGTTAVVKESVITAESLTPMTHHSYDSSAEQDYQVFTVWYKIVAEGDAWSSPYMFMYSDSITGEVSRWVVSVSETSAYYAIPKEGDVINLIFNPDVLDDFKVGTTEEWRMQIKTTSPRIFIPIIFVLLILVLVLFDVRIKLAMDEY